jgi:hypothetical protein
MKKSNNKPRNSFVITMNKSRKGGAMRNKNTKRRNNKNKQTEYLKEEY